MDYYSSRCDRYFVNGTALYQHRRDSDRHWVCDFDWCDAYDVPTWLDLAHHCDDHEHGSVCWGCSTIFDDAQDLGRHIEEDNVCEECSRHFDTPNNLIMHELTHRRADIECYLCGDDRLFTTYSGMIIHLEAGNCSRVIDLVELNYFAAQCYGWPALIDSDLRYVLLNKDSHYLFDSRKQPFKCPTCDSKFTKLSGLFQHIESPACSQSLTKGVIRTLRRRLRNVSLKLDDGTF